MPDPCYSRRWYFSYGGRPVLRSCLTLSAFIFNSLAIGQTATFAQITGKVIGTVADADSGVPVGGAEVVVEGTNLETITGDDGSYVIDNAPVGLREMSVHYLDTQTTRDNLRILAGQTTRVDFAVKQAGRIGMTLKRAALVLREGMNPRSALANYAPTRSSNDILELGVGIYPHPSLQPEPWISRAIGREEIGSYRIGAYRGILPWREPEVGERKLQPRLKVSAISPGLRTKVDNPQARRNKDNLEE